MSDLTRKKADLIIDLQFGSTGKGLIAGYLAANGNYDMVVNANMPNAGHTYIDVNGNKMMHKVLPNGVVGKSVKHVVIGAGSIFDLNQLQKEIDNLWEFGYDHFQLHIHENAVVLNNHHADLENMADLTANIGSTSQGTLGAIVEKLCRATGDACEEGYTNPCAKFALAGTHWGEYLITNREYLNLLHQADNVLLEGAQGYSLGLNAGFYPFTTSRDCTPARFLADMGVPHTMLRKVIGTARMHPIRVGGNSGPCYADQSETTWEKLELNKEFTTVTNRERRVFTWSQLQIEGAMMACQPDEVFLNFCNYDKDLVPKILNNIYEAAMFTGCVGQVRYMGWGPSHNDVHPREAYHG